LLVDQEVASLHAFIGLTFAITGVQKQSEAARLHVWVDGVVRHQLQNVELPIFVQVVPSDPKVVLPIRLTDVPSELNRVFPIWVDDVPSE